MAVLVGELGRVTVDLGPLLAAALAGLSVLLAHLNVIRKQLAEIRELRAEVVRLRLEIATRSSGGRTRVRLR